MSDTPTNPIPDIYPHAGLPTNDVRTLLGLLTEDEFGRAVGVVGSTVAIWRNRGEGPPFYRFKRNIFYRTADVVQWVIENTWDPASDTLLVPPKLSAEDTAFVRKARRVYAASKIPELTSTPQRSALDDADEDPVAAAAEPAS